jgi:hypothetical protein
MAEERMNDARKIPNEPMGYLRKLVVRAIAEKAYSPDGKDASCLTLGKRAGGTSHLLGRWRLDDGMDGDMGLLLDLRDLIAWQVSRRAVYLVSESLRDLPVEQAALASALAYRFGKQSKTDGPNPLEAV